MKPAILLALALAATPAVAQLYKYVDKDGRTVYSDQPPANVETKRVHVPARAAAPAASGNKSAVERDKELQKSRDEAAEKSKKAEQSARQAEEAEQRCREARAAHQTYVDGGRIHKYNDKGERVFLGDEEIEVERERTRREMEEACKT